MELSVNPKPLGTEFKVITDRVISCFLSVDVQRGKDWTIKEKYVKDVMRNHCVYISMFSRKINKYSSFVVVLIRENIILGKLCTTTTI